jgi:hypothetical protein
MFSDLIISTRVSRCRCCSKVLLQLFIVSINIDFFLWTSFGRLTRANTYLAQDVWITPYSDLFVVVALASVDNYKRSRQCGTQPNRQW